MFFDTGTIKGTSKISFVTTLAPPVPPATLPTIAYTGTLAVTGTSPEAKRTSLTEVLTLRGFR